MLYAFYGTDSSLAAKKALSLVESLRSKRPDAAFVRIEADMWSISAIEEHAGGQGLFSSKYIILLDRVTERVAGKEELPGMLALMQESTNVFIILEGKPNTELKKAIDATAEKAVMCDLAEKVSKGREEFNIFALADAVGERDSFKAWKVYRDAIDAGIEPEAIAGTLFWQAKSMMLAASAGSASETGLSPFVYTKASRAAKRYSPDELGSLAERIVAVYHDGHRGVRDIELGLERMLLEV